MAGANYIDGKWVQGAGADHVVINPATEEQAAHIRLVSQGQLDAAVSAARRASETFSRTSVAQRLELLGTVMRLYAARRDELAQAITAEMGCPITLSKMAQAASGLGHLNTTMQALAEFAMESRHGRSTIRLEPIGVVGLITPWNWPMNQIVAKVAPALAAGCSIILKPSELTPTNAIIFTEILEAAGVPPGVFNLVQGDGVIGAAMASHAGIDMISITGSTRASVEVAKRGAETVKRVHQELGGKSPSVILDDAPLEAAITGTVRVMMANSGQSCTAPSRLIVPRSKLAAATEIAAAAADAIQLGDPATEGAHIGPIANARQYERVVALIERGAAEGSRIVAGAAARPDAFERGYFVRPTVFGDVDNASVVAREEIFGPVLCIIAHEGEDDAVRIANDTVYGLSSHVWADDPAIAERVAGQIKAGHVHVNGAGLDFAMPFGGYKQSGNGREFGAHGLREFLETKAIMHQA
jgi:aldehyde dehydrogenase (NAD+)